MALLLAAPMRPRAELLLGFRIVRRLLTSSEDTKYTIE